MARPPIDRSTRSAALATGEQIDVVAVHHLTIRDGQIVRYRPLLDTHAMIEATKP